VTRVVLPPPELGCVERKLQPIFARLQVLLRLLSRVEILDHSYVAQQPTRPVANDVHRYARPDCGSVFTDVALFHIESGQLTGD
jgi:hypothetical protein